MTIYDYVNNTVVNLGTFFLKGDVGRGCTCLSVALCDVIGVHVIVSGFVASISGNPK